jgi:hypothetical protein
MSKIFGSSNSILCASLAPKFQYPIADLRSPVQGSEQRLWCYDRPRVVQLEQSGKDGGSLTMLTAKENKMLTEDGKGKPMGEFMRRHWIPAAKSEEMPTAGGAPVRVKLLADCFVLATASSA